MDVVRVCKAIGGLSKQTSSHVSVMKLLGDNVGRECLEILNYFKRRQEEDGSYYFDMELSDDGTLVSVF